MKPIPGASRFIVDVMGQTATFSKRGKTPILQPCINSIIKENFKINKTTILFSQKPHFFAPYICFLIPEILFRQSLSNHLHHSAMSINCYWQLKWLWQFRLPYLLLPLLQVTNQFHQIIRQK